MKIEWTGVLCQELLFVHGQLHESVTVNVQLPVLLSAKKERNTIHQCNFFKFEDTKHVFLGQDRLILL